MTVINRSALLAYSAHQLFDLVRDVESYPAYMDGCVGAQILRAEEHLLEARLDLARGAIRQSFSTRNRMLAPREITLGFPLAGRLGLQDEPASGIYH
jgi:ribosome-associated toxin RatA of RatAB toxin-antitoxin module